MYLCTELDIFLTTALTLNRYNHCLHALCDLVVELCYIVDVSEMNLSVTGFSDSNSCFSDYRQFCYWNTENEFVAVTANWMSLFNNCRIIGFRFCQIFPSSYLLCRILITYIISHFLLSPPYDMAVENRHP